MQNMRKYKTIITLTLILCFLTFQITKPRQAYAFAPAVGLAVAAVLAVGTAAGLTYTFDNATGDAIASRLQAFLDDVHPGQAIADYFSARNTAIKDGLMYIGASLYSRIKEFFSWEQSESGVTAGNTVSYSFGENGFITVDDLRVLTTSYFKGRIGLSTVRLIDGSLGTRWLYSSLTESPLIVAYTDICYMKIYILDNYIYFDVSSDGGNNYSTFYRSSVSYPLNETFLMFYNTELWSGSGIYGPMPICSSESRQQSYSSDPHDGWYLVYHELSRFPWTQEVYLNSSQFLEITEAGTLSLTASDVIAFPDVLEGQSVCVDVGMLTDATADQIADEIIDAAIDGTLSPSISAETWTVDVVATPQDLAQDLDIDLDTTTDIVDDPTVPDTPDDTVEFDTPEHYTVRDLSRFFPFCIPFDVVGLLGVLNADPVTPHFEYRFNPSFLNVDHTIVIDLGQFDTLAALLRRLETLGFCVGLAMVTRNLIRG